MGKCVFCDEAARPATAKAFLGPLWPGKDRLLYENATAFVVPGLSPQVYPYALVLPRRHVLSLARLDLPERLNLLDCLRRITTLSPFSGRRVVVFEHGGCSRPDGNGCLEHAHLHVVADSAFLLAELANSFPVVAVELSEDSSLPIEDSYLFAGAWHEDRIVGVFARRVRFERQFFRRLLAKHGGDNRWDWHLGINPHLVEKLYRVATEAQ